MNVRVLYLTNRFNTTCKVICQFICTRVTHPEQDDKSNLVKLLSHLWIMRKNKYLFGRGTNYNHLRHYVEGWLLSMGDQSSMQNRSNMTVARKIQLRTRESLSLIIFQR